MVMMGVIETGAPCHCMGAVFVEQGTPFSSWLPQPRYRAMSAGLRENNGVASVCGYTGNEVRDLSLGLAVPPMPWQTHIGFMAARHAGKATIALVHIVQLERDRN